MEEMIFMIKSFLAPLLAATILTMGGGLLNSLLSINMSLSGYSEQTIGLVLSGNYLGMILGIFFCQPIVQRVGHIRAFAVFAAVLTALALMYGLYMSPWFWALLRICGGLCVTGLFMVIESWLNEKVEPMVRGRLLSIYMILIYFGNGCGQLLLNVSNVQEKSIFMIAGILFAICLIPISITRAVNPQPLKVPRYNMIKLFRLAPFSMVGCLTAGLISSSFYALGPVFALKIGLEISQVSLFMSITVWSGLLFQWPVGLLSDRLDRLTVLSILGFAVLFVSVSISMLGPLSLSLLLLLSACFSVAFAIYPVAMARAQDNIDKEDIVPVSGALILFFGVGACIGPVLSSWIIAWVGPWGLYHFTATCGGILGCAAWICRKWLKGKFEDQVPFVYIPRTSPVVSALDPRGDPDDYGEK
jgi:MFS family permease